MRGVEPTPILVIRDELLQRAAVEGVPSLAYPAQQYLELLGGELNVIPNRVVGSSRAYTGPMRPLDKDGPSTGMFRWTFGLKERVWSRYDFGDTLPMSKTRARRMNLPEHTPETHKCFSYV